MKQVIILVLIFFPIISNCQWDPNPIIEYYGDKYILNEEQDTNYVTTEFDLYYKYDSIGNYQGNSDIFPKDGKWISFYKQDTSRVARIFSVINNKFNGKSTVFRFDGSKESESYYSDNILDGYSILWHTNGQISNISFYKSTNFGHFSKEVLHGTFQSWYPDGSLKSTTEYLDDQNIGKSILYYKNGNVFKEKPYQDGELNGDYLVKHENGQLYKKINYKNNVAVNQIPAIFYHPNGQISETGNFIVGQNNGFWQYYNPDGKLMSEGNWNIVPMEHVHGILSLSVKGTDWKYYYPNGQIMAKGNYNVKEEADRYFDEKYESFRDEKWNYYDEKGTKITHQAFADLKIKLKEHIIYEE